jgi:hypothetical protein
MSIGKPISTHLPTWNVKNHALELQLLHEYPFPYIYKKGLDYRQERNNTQPKRTKIFRLLLNVEFW